MQAVIPVTIKQLVNAIATAVDGDMAIDTKDMKHTYVKVVARVVSDYVCTVPIVVPVSHSHLLGGVHSPILVSQSFLHLFVCLASIIHCLRCLSPMELCITVLFPIPPCCRFLSASHGGVKSDFTRSLAAAL